MNYLKYLFGLLSGKKTYIVAIVTVLYAIVVVGIGQNDWSGAVALILGASGLGALRHGVGKAQ